jgi:NADPH:quinone reductase-like Zn-dependent oxidoreductase
MLGIRIPAVSFAVASMISLAALAAPAKMDAIVQTEFTAAGMKLQSVDTPKPAANQVLMKVHAAGVLDSVGPGVTALKVGDAVVARVTGAMPGSTPCA